MVGYNRKDFRFRREYGATGQIYIYKERIPVHASTPEAQRVVYLLLSGYDLHEHSITHLIEPIPNTVPRSDVVHRPSSGRTQLPDFSLRGLFPLCYCPSRYFSYVPPLPRGFKLPRLAARSAWAQTAPDDRNFWRRSPTNTNFWV